MSRETIYEIASEMLRNTNIFHKDITEIKFTNSQQDVVSLVDLVKTEATLAQCSRRGRTEENLQRAYNSIAQAMIVYLSTYTAAFSFKRRTMIKFSEWLDKIYDLYEIHDTTAGNDLKVNRADVDIGIAMLKALHPRQGVTIEELEDQLKITDRAVQKDLVKLDPSLYERGKRKEAKTKMAPYSSFLLGGQPLQASISYDDTISPRRFYSQNTVHPLVLQENIMELATLLKALCRQFFDFEDDKSRLIAIDIWYQISEYAQRKIKYYFAFDNPDLSDFIAMLEDDCPDDHVCGYHTERELLNMIDASMPIDDALSHLMKVEGRTGLIVLKTGEIIEVKQLLPVYKSDGSSAYQARSVNGEITVFTKDQVKDIQI